MGNSQKTVEYARFIGYNSKYESQTLRNSKVESNGELTSRSDPNIRTTIQGFKALLPRVSDKPFLGTRAKLKSGEAGGYEWKTFRQVHEQVLTLAKGIQALELCPESDEFEGQQLSFMGLYSKNREEYLTLDWACQYNSVTTVALYDTLGSESVAYIVNQTGLTTIACDVSLVEKLLLFKKTNGAKDSLKNIITFDALGESGNPDVTSGHLLSGGPDGPALRALANDLGVRVLHFKDIIQAGVNMSGGFKENLPTKDTVITLCYTSGTTGDPKGAMLTHANLTALLSGIINQGVTLGPGEMHLSYLPMAHIFEKVMANGALYFGHSIGFYQGDVTKIVDDVQTLRPTIFASVPRLYNRIYDRIKARVAGIKGCKKMLFDSALKTKLKQATTSGNFHHFFWDCLIFKKIKKLLGGRVKLMVSGGAPLSGEVKNMLRVCFSCPVIEAYGQTECSGACCIEKQGDPFVGSVGGPLSCSDIKVMEVPDLDYFPGDVIEGIQMPRGEVCIKGPIVFKGYYKNPAATADAIDSDGWLHTGDIGMIRPNGSLSIVDRKKHIFKLAQGEYIAPEKLENIYVQSKYLQQVFIHGDSIQTAIVGILVVDPDSAKIWGEKKGAFSEGDLSDIANSSEFQAEVMRDLMELADANKLSGLEKLKKAHFTIDPFSAEDDTLTPTFKLKRGKARDKWKAIIAQLYA